jgi:hypothetical protein
MLFAAMTASPRAATALEADQAEVTPAAISNRPINRAVILIT